MGIAFCVGSEWESIVKAPCSWGRPVVVSVVINVTRQAPGERELLFFLPVAISAISPCPLVLKCYKLNNRQCCRNCRLHLSFLVQSRLEIPTDCICCFHSSCRSCATSVRAELVYVHQHLGLFHAKEHVQKRSVRFHQVPTKDMHGVAHITSAFSNLSGAHTRRHQPLISFCQRDTKQTMLCWGQRMNTYMHATADQPAGCSIALVMIHISNLYYSGAPADYKNAFAYRELLIGRPIHCLAASCVSS